MLSGIPWWALLLGGLESEIHNLNVRMKEPFRRKLKAKYQTKYNDEHLFSSFIQDNRAIHSWNKHYDSMWYGNGLFLHHFINAYQQEGKRVKLILTGQKHYGASYFEKEYGMKATRIDIKEQDTHESLFQQFVDNHHEILSLNHTTWIKDQSITRHDFLLRMFTKVAQLPKDENTLYLVCLLFIHDQEKPAIDVLMNQNQVRLFYMNPDYCHWVDKMKEEDLHILIPHYAEKVRHDGRDLEAVKEKFPHVPPWVFQKTYYSYHQFIYQRNEQCGFYFMDVPVKEEK